jgi:hypothetical protein
MFGNDMLLIDKERMENKANDCREHSPMNNAPFQIAPPAKSENFQQKSNGVASIAKGNDEHKEGGGGRRYTAMSTKLSFSFLIKSHSNVSHREVFSDTG